MGTEQTAPTLTSRQREILCSIVQNYIETGEPVASKTLSEARRQSLSSASIRNVMAELNEQGYLAQPHTSAGRVPTRSAFMLYANSLPAVRLPLAQSERVRTELNEANSFEGRVERSSRLLTELTDNIGIAASVPSTARELDQIELLALADRRVLIVVVTRDGMVSNRAVTLDYPLSQDELNSLRNYVNRSFGGWKLRDARQELLRRIAEESAAYDGILSKMGGLCRRGLLEGDAEPEVHLGGVSNLLMLDLHLERGRLREMLHALEQKRRLVDLLDRFLEAPGELAVRVGLEEVDPLMGDFSMVGISVTLPGGLTAKVAVLGPMRMRYERALSAVLHLGRALAAVPV